MATRKLAGGGIPPARPPWKRAPAEVVERFAKIAGQFAGAEKRKMFGYPCVFMNGNMIAGVHGDDTFLRLSPPDREAFLRLEDAHVLEPIPGRPMKAYVVAPVWLLDRDAELVSWIDRAQDYGAALPPKVRPGK